METTTAPTATVKQHTSVKAPFRCTAASHPCNATSGMKPTIISKGNRKLGRMINVSMTPIKACGNCKHCARKCYALKAYRMYTDTKIAWDHNFELAKSDPVRYFQGIVNALKAKTRRGKGCFFRWHVAGDILSQSYYNDMVRIASMFPLVSFLCFTKMHDLDFSRKPANLQLIASMFPGMPVPTRYATRKLPIAWMQDGTEKRIPVDAVHCPGSCDNCKLCFDTTRDVVFNAH